MLSGFWSLHLSNVYGKQTAEEEIHSWGVTFFSTVFLTFKFLLNIFVPCKDSARQHAGSVSHSAAPHTVSTQHEGPPPSRRGRCDLLTSEDSELHARMGGEKQGAGAAGCAAPAEASSGQMSLSHWGSEMKTGRTIPAEGS